jgi:hypothetical protein
MRDVTVNVAGNLVTAGILYIAAVAVGVIAGNRLLLRVSVFSVATFVLTSALLLVVGLTRLSVETKARVAMVGMALIVISLLVAYVLTRDSSWLTAS